MRFTTVVGVNDSHLLASAFSLEADLQGKSNYHQIDIESEGGTLTN